MSGSNKDQMHPEDMRNLLIFMIVSVLLWFSYDHFILGPQKKALQEARQAQAELMATQSPEEQQAQTSSLRPRTEILHSVRRVEIDNGQIFGSVSLRGGRLNDISFHEYFDTLEKQDNVVLLSPNGTEFPRYIDYGWATADKNIPVPDSETPWRVSGNDKLTHKNPVVLVWDNGQGLKFERRIAIDENYLFTVTQQVINNSGKTVTLYPYGLISQTGIPADFQRIWFMHEGPIGWVGDELAEITYKDLRKNGGQVFSSNGGWAGVTDKYWLTAFIPSQDQKTKYSFKYAVEDTPGGEGRYQVDFVGPATVLSPGERAENQSHVFTGAKKVLLLNEYGRQFDVPNFDLAVDFGWLWFLSKPFFYALHFFGKFTGNLGIAIILVTILIRTAVFPLTNTSYRSFAKMKKVTPQITALREKHGDDKAQLQKELVKMYEREGVNPMAGCFPILLQIPIFFALYKVLFVTIEVRHAPFFGWIQDLSARDPTSLFNLFGLIPWEPPGFLQIGVWPCLMLVAMIIQRHLNPPPQDPLQRDMARYFPFIITYILSRFASGLVIYWTFSAFIGVVQQMIIMRSLGVPIHLFGQTDEEKKLDEAVEKGPGVHPLVEMAEDEVEEAMFGEHEDEPEKKKITPPKRKKKKKKK